MENNKEVIINQIGTKMVNIREDRDGLRVELEKVRLISLKYVIRDLATLILFTLRT